ncbi:MAG: LPS assembly lipoprotein LptE [Caldimonas sp.]
MVRRPAPTIVSRRALLLDSAVVVAASSALAGCGFALKHAPELRFKTIQLTGFTPRSPLAAELRMNIDSSLTTRVVESAKDAEVVLHALTDAREKSVVAQTAANQIREFELRSRFRFELRTVGGKELIPPTEIVLKRSLTYTESAALAKEQEEAFLYRAMQIDIASQVLRRLASVRLL